MRRLSTLLCTVVASTSASHAATPLDIGTTVSVIDVVTAELSTERRNLATGDAVRQNEVIEASPTARSELKLDDETKLALGPGARLVLDRFVYDPDKKSGNIAIDLAKGAFRFMTGVASKPSYVIRVPAAAITVRGTIFDVFVQASGAAWLLLHEGGVQVCNARGNCRVLDEPGKLILVNGDGDVGKPVRWANLDGLQGFDFDDAFPFVGEAPSIDPKPIFTKQALIEDAPAPKPAGKAKSEVKGADQQEAAKPNVKKPIKVSVRKPKRNTKVAEVEDAEPPRVVSKPPRNKPPRIKIRPTKTPKDTPTEVTDKRKKWRRIAETAASEWIDRVRARRRGKDYESGPSLGGIGTPHRPIVRHTPPAGEGTGRGPTKFGSSGLR